MFKKRNLRKLKVCQKTENLIGFMKNPSALEQKHFFKIIFYSH